MSLMSCGCCGLPAACPARRPSVDHAHAAGHHPGGSAEVAVRLPCAGAALLSWEPYSAIAGASSCLPLPRCADLLGIACNTRGRVIEVYARPKLARMLPTGDVLVPVLGVLFVRQSSSQQWHGKCLGRFYFDRLRCCVCKGLCLVYVK
jgi:hypothetical protein